MTRRPRAATAALNISGTPAGSPPRGGGLPAALPLPDPGAVAHVRRSFARVGDADAFAGRFYERLFHLRPEVRPLFGSDLADQRQKLARTLALVVHGLVDFERLRAAVESLGRAHVGYGVSEVHYAAVGAALVWSLEREPEGLASAERQAWLDVYGFLSNVMIRAARLRLPSS